MDLMLCLCFDSVSFNSVGMMPICIHCLLVLFVVYW